MTTGTSHSGNKKYDAAYTYFFVPKSLAQASTPAVDVPGAMLRLGSYSDLEADAADLSQFYPRKYGSTLVGDETSQILLSCGGQMLIYAGEKLFINSRDEMDIDSVGSLRINSDDKTTITSENEVDLNSRKRSVSVTSGPGEDIVITAGENGNYGDIEKTARHRTETYFGQDMTVVTEDSKTYFKANKYSYTQGNTLSIYLGTTSTFNAAANLTIGANIDLYIGGSTTYVKLHSMAITGFNVAITGLNTSIIGVDTGKAFVNAKDANVRGGRSQVKFVADGVWAGTKEIATLMGSAAVNMYGTNIYM